MYQLVLKVLGVQIDEHLSWNQHIEYIANKIAIVRYWSRKEIKNIYRHVQALWFWYAML